MTKLIVKDIVGPYGMRYEDGAKVYNEIYPLLEASQQVELDFQEMRITTSSFFNGFILKLLKKFTDLDHWISYVNLTGRDKFVLSYTLKAAKRRHETHA